jgi:hypothetical protein
MSELPCLHFTLVIFFGAQVSPNTIVIFIVEQDDTVVAEPKLKEYKWSCLVQTIS